MMNSHPSQQSGDNTAGDFQSPAMSYNMNTNMNNNMNTNNNMNMNNNVNDLQFTTSVDTSVQQNVPIPPIISASQIPNNNANYSTNVNAPTSSDNGVIAQVFKNSAHPTIALFHCLFKALALTFYISSGWLSTERFIIITVTCVVLLAMDFWVVKNVTGRLLVGLRWWSQNVGEDGTETKWIFESNSGDKAVNNFDQSVFWTVLYSTPVVWCWLFLVGLFKVNFKWLITVSFGIALSGANTYGYYQCSKDQRAKFQRMMTRGAEMGALSAIRNSDVLGKMGSFAAGLANFGASSVTNANANANANTTGGGGAGGYANVNPQQQPQQYNQQQQPQQYNNQQMQQFT